MYNKIQIVIKYLHFYFTASNGRGHGMHSPFVFHFITKVLNDKTKYNEYNTVEELRKKLLADKSVLTVEDFGAGSAVSKSNQRSIASITKYSAKSKKLAQLLFRIVKMYKPGTIFELGTSVGITTSYLSLANPGAKLITLEGATEVSAIAKKKFNDLGLKNITVLKGNFDNILANSLMNFQSVDFVFIDGNHRKEPTERYFSMLLPYLNNESILIFDDIHWSLEMEQAWKNIQSHNAVRCTIDLFYFGIVLVRPEFKERQHFKVRF